MSGRRASPMSSPRRPSCGASDEEELLNWTLAHVSRNHSAVGLTDEQVQQIVKEGAYDTPGKAQEGRTSS